MTVLVTHMSALDFWRRVYPGGKAPDAGDCVIPSGRFVSNEEEVWSVLPAYFSTSVLEPEQGKLHVTVSDKVSRRASASIIPHVWNGRFVEGSFYRMGEDVYISSPEMLFVQMAQTLSLPQLIALGDELCGLYSFDSRKKKGMRQRKVALTSRERLLSFTASMRNSFAGTDPVKDGSGRGPRGCYGISKAERALKHVVNFSASPRETALVIFLTLPCSMGGYGLRKPLMNLEMPLSSEAASIAGRNTVRPDLLWKKESLDLEYDGIDSHSGEEACDSDRSRTIALELDGYDVIEMSKSQLNSWWAFESVALMLSNKLGKRIYKRDLGPTPQRLSLRDEVFSWNKASGRA